MCHHLRGIKILKICTDIFTHIPIQLYIQYLSLTHSLNGQLIAAFFCILHSLFPSSSLFMYLLPQLLSPCCLCTHLPDTRIARQTAFFEYMQSNKSKHINTCKQRVYFCHVMFLPLSFFLNQRCIHILSLILICIISLLCIYIFY